MNEQTFDTFTRRAAGGVTRRTSLTTLGTAGLAALGMVGLAALTRPFPTEAKKGNTKNTSRKKATKRCKNDLAAACTAQGASCSTQAEECTTFLSAVCTSAPSCPSMIACCTFLGSCDAGTFLTCLDNAGAA